jgi:RimJ/RimL family protein N-acetyltransferase
MQIAAWLSRPEINQWLTGEWRNRAANPSILAIACRNRRNRLFLVRHDGGACGLVGLAEIDRADRIAMVWYLLGDERVKRRGIISEAVRQVAKLAFSEMELMCIYAWIMEENCASRRVLEKSGFREVGRVRRAANFNGRQMDRVYFDLLPG